MLTLLSEVHFWTLKDETIIHGSDLGAFRYFDKKSTEDIPILEGKKVYAEKRGHPWVLPNKRPARLKDNLKELEECLSNQRLVLYHWRDSNVIQLMFSSGLLTNLLVNPFTGDLVNIAFDKYLVGKLLSDYVSDVVLTKSHLICSYNDSQLTLVYFTKPALKRNAPKSLSRLDPRIQTVDLAGPAGRRLERKLASNVSGDMVVVWWHCSGDEVYPWSPVVKDKDRANILVYGISGTKADLLCYHRSEFDLICVSFSQTRSNIIYCVEQKVSRKGNVTIECSCHQVGRSRLQKSSLVSIPLPTHVCCHAFSKEQDKILFGCIDGSLVLYYEGCGVTHIVKAAFIPSVISWHSDGAAVLVANERCQFQLFDSALASLNLQIMSDDVSSSSLLDLASYFRIQPKMINALWNEKPDKTFYSEKYASTDILILLHFERGPLATLRLIGGGGLARDVHRCNGLSVDSLISHYLWVGQVDSAINLLLTLNWNVSGNACLSSLHRILNYLFRLPLTSEREVQLQTALGSFHIPVRPMCPATFEEFGPLIKDLTKRFFHHLLRHKLFEKAFRLAIDLQDRALFLDIHFSAQQAGEAEIAEAAYNKIEELSVSSSTSGSTSSLCFRSSCSECSSIASSDEDIKLRTSRHRHSRRSRHSQTQRQRPVGRSASDKNGSSPLISANKTSNIPNSDVVVGFSTSSNVPGSDRVLNTAVLERNYAYFSATAGMSNQAAPISANTVESSNSDDLRDYGAFSRSAQNNPTLQHARQKVKFCGAIAETSVPERLHPLFEEEEELPPYCLRPENLISSTSPSAKIYSGLRYQYKNALELSARSLHSDSTIISNSATKQNLKPNFLLNNPCSPPQTSNAHCAIDIISHDFNCNLENEKWDQPDSLDTEELCSLLPGSRKPVAATISSSIHDSFLAASTVLDLSEEEEANGTIKIVHFGVV